MELLIFGLLLMVFLNPAEPEKGPNGPPQAKESSPPAAPQDQGGAAQGAVPQAPEVAPSPRPSRLAVED